MPDNSLPDEIISEILSPALKVSDDIFSDTSNVSPFSQYLESTSAYLLVSKSWLRVATPLLYHVVILRSKAQAKALSHVLSKNQELGQFIKKLRVEGGYGPPMFTILQLSPNITDLVISFEIWSTDNTSGLCKGLGLVNPTRVILRDLDCKRTKNKMVADLENALIKAIARWDRLLTFGLPYLPGDYYSQRSSRIIEALGKAQRLQTVHVRYTSVNWIFSVLKDRCPLQAIWIQPAVPEAYLKYSGIANDAALKALVKMRRMPLEEDSRKASYSNKDSDLPEIAPSLNPSFVPMSEASNEDKDTVWKRILYFAMSVSELEQNPRATKLLPRLPILLVSKTFKRLALPHLYVHTMLKNARAVSAFLTVLCSNPSLGPQVRSISGDEVQSYSAFTNLDHAEVVSILSRTTGLVRFAGWSAEYMDEENGYMAESTIHWDAFEAVAKSSGATLREFSKRIDIVLCRTGSPAVLDNFTQLRSLDWKCPIAFECEPKVVAYSGFPQLEELRIWEADSSFLTVLTMMKLESIRLLFIFDGVEASEKLLEMHGSKLTQLRMESSTVDTLNANIFTLCSNLESLSLKAYVDVPYGRHFNSIDSVPSLLKICITLKEYRRKKERRAFPWESLFSEFETRCFPNLREIQINSCEWPTSEREISKSRWVTWAEVLLKDNVNLTDASGKKWRPRLKLK
ncbi:hypothetical protein B0H15DRAFT_1023684 [Mycena belliarum]|uniref:Uncharacterized protein n=1 Tax=Mycena belliarum TaxID=1033014 RepID=A0AAD6TZG7_9AGAR|nr:hypothetical protein B0H15DRAFT_1023684 [Mycena belliae]